MKKTAATPTHRRGGGKVFELVLLLAVFLMWVGRAPALSQSIIENISASSQFSASVGSGARALAMGGAFIAVADDGTAASWNPAGLCVLERPEASLVWQGANERQTSFSAITLDNRAALASVTGELHLRAGSEILEESGRPFDFASFAYPVRWRRWKLVPQFSFQRAIDFSVNSHASPTLRESIQVLTADISGDIEASTFESSFFRSSSEGRSSGGIDIYAASVGVSFREDLYFGVSLNWWRGGIDSVNTTLGTLEERSQGPFYGGGSTTVAEQSESVSRTESVRGFNTSFGVLWNPISRLRLGAVFKTPFDLHRTIETTSVSGEFSLEMPSEDASVSVSSFDSTEEGSVEWPRTLGFGGSFSPTESLTLSSDFTWSAWSDVVYQASSRVTFFPEQDESFEEIRTNWPTRTDPDLPESDINLRQIDTQQLRFGVEYLIVSPRFAGLSALPVRAGAFTDRQYFKETNRDPVTYAGITAGFGLVWSHFSFDVAYVHKSASFRNREFFLTDPSAFDPQLEEFVAAAIADDDDAFRSNQLYLSAMVRF